MHACVQAAWTQGPALKKPGLQGRSLSGLKNDFNPVRATHAKRWILLGDVGRFDLHLITFPDGDPGTDTP